MKYGYKCIGSYIENIDADRPTKPTKELSVFWKSSRGIEAWCTSAMSDINGAFRRLPSNYKSTDREYNYVVEVYEE